ncbi:MAG: Gfo/Idh/MocA family oxidoreductase [Deltaproteobacteria bacterium]|nr:Gfo/Idh/MocA family oxidoreductase [Deltaproteobacteria bacterium]
MSDSIVSLGIIGCGVGARNVHLPALARVPRLRVAALCDSSEAALASALLGASARRLADWRQLLGAPDLDALAVLTPPDTHAELGCAVLASGKHLFLDKPLAASAADGERLVAAARSSRGKAFLGHNYRWHRLVEQGRSFVRSGALGALRAIRSVYTHHHRGPGVQPWHRLRSRGGGVLLNDGVHHFDMWRFLLDREIEELKLHSADTEEFQDQTCTVSARLSGGVLGSAIFSFGSGAESVVEIFGDEGRLELSLYQFDGLRFVPAVAPPGGFGVRARAAAASLRSLPVAVRGLRGQGDVATAAVDMWRSFADCVLRDLPPPCTLLDGRQAMRALFDALS